MTLLKTNSHQKTKGELTTVGPMDRSELPKCYGYSRDKTLSFYQRRVLQSHSLGAVIAGDIPRKRSTKCGTSAPVSNTYGRLTIETKATRTLNGKPIENDID